MLPMIRSALGRPDPRKKSQGQRHSSGPTATTPSSVTPSNPTPMAATTVTTPVSRKSSDSIPRYDPASSQGMQVKAPVGSKPQRKSPKVEQVASSGWLPIERVTKVELADEIFILIDLNKDDEIDFSEWTLFFDVATQNAGDITWALNPFNARQDVKNSADFSSDAFDAADTDSSAAIGKKEWHLYLQTVVKAIGNEKWKQVSRRMFNALTEKNENGALIAPHKVSNARGIEAKQKNALNWLEVDTDDWLKPDGDSAVRFSPMEVALLKKYFKMRDVDGSLSLSWAELEYVMKDIGRMPATDSEEWRTLERLKEHADKNKDGCLNFDEFCGFLAAYYHALYEFVFNAFDADGNGTMSTGEYEAVLATLGKAGFEVSWDRVSELMQHVDVDSNGTLDFDEFSNLMQLYRKIEFEHLQNTSGFPMRKVDGIRQLFDSADMDESGSLSPREVGALLEKTNLGDALNTREHLHAFSCLFKRMDRDQDCALDFEEFLRLLRVWSRGGHVAEAEELSTLQKKMRLETFGEAKNAILDGWAEEFEHDMQDANLSGAWDVPAQEIRTIRDIFEFTDINGSGTIQSLELLPLMECVGHKIKDGKMKEALDMALEGRDMVDGLSFPEAVEVLCTFEKNLSIMVVGGLDRKVKRSQILSGLYTIGVYITPKAAEELFAKAFPYDSTSLEESVDYKDFMCLLKTLRSQHMARWCESCGFKRAHVDKYGQAFTAMLMEFGNPECELILEKVQELLQNFNLVGQGPAERSKMYRAITRVDRDNSGTMSFEEFLLLVRYLKNKEMYRETCKNQEAMQKHGIDGESGEQLCKLFLDKDADDDYTICQEDVVTIFKELGVARKPSEQQKIRDCLSVWSKGDNDLLMTFPEFLDVLQEMEKSL